jgi:2-phosphoglycerate kinase
MLHWSDNSILLGTGLPLKTIGEVLAKGTTKQELVDLLAKLGEKYLKRYNILSNYWQLVHSGRQKLPIVILIAGFPSVGKTAIAKDLACRLNIGPVFGGDALRSVIRGLVSQKSNEFFFTSVYDSWQAFGEKSKENMLKGFQQQAAIMNNAVQRLIADRGLRDGESMIVEYLHFLPEQFNSDLFAHPSFIPIVLKITDKEEYKHRMEQRATFSHLRSPGKRLISNIDSYLLFQEYQCKRAKEFNLPIVIINNFEKGYDMILNIIFQKLQILNEQLDYTKSIPSITRIENERKN